MDPDEFPVTKYTVQLYLFPFSETIRSFDRDDAPVQIASGVLIKRHKKHFLLTCKHVFDHIKISDVIILTSSGFSVRLPDEIKFVNNATDSIDLALVEIKKERLAALKYRYSFLPYKNLGFSHVFDEDLFYMLYGYINKHTELKEQAYFEVASFAHLTNIRYYKRFEELGFNYNENISLEYNRRKQSDFDDTRMISPKDLKGMSGGGIWLSVAGRKKDTYHYLLVGIMIEERLERGFIIGTKIRLIQNELI
jgi:hypothetical protein